MISRIKNHLIKFFISSISFLFLKIFHEEISEEMHLFLRNISYVSIGTIITAFFSFSFNILAGRLLSPAGYGTYSLILSTAMFLFIPMLLGFNNAIIKYCAETKESNLQSQIISTSFIIVGFLTFISTFVFLIFSSEISNLLFISKEIYFSALLFAVFYVFYILMTNTLNGLREIKLFAIFQALNSIAVLLIFLFLIIIRFISYESMIYAIIISYGIIGSAIYFLIIKKYINLDYNKKISQILLKFGVIAGIGGFISTLYTYIDRILINNYIGIESLGLYTAYYYSAFAVPSFLLGIFITVFFPSISKYHDKSAIYRKIHRMIPIIIIIGMPIIIISEFVVLHLFGSKYPFYPVLLMLFAIVAILAIWYGLYAWLFSSEGIHGVKVTLSVQILIALIIISGDIILIPCIGLNGAVISLICAYIAGIILIYYLGGIFYPS